MPTVGASLERIWAKALGRRYRPGKDFWEILCPAPPVRLRPFLGGVPNESQVADTVSRSQFFEIGDRDFAQKEAALRVGQEIKNYVSLADGYAAVCEVCPLFLEGTPHARGG